MICNIIRYKVLQLLKANLMRSDFKDLATPQAKTIEAQKDRRKDHFRAVNGFLKIKILTLCDNNTI